MIDLNLNIIGGVLKNKSSNDARLFVNYIQPTSSFLSANIEGTGSAGSFLGPRYINETFTSNTSSFRKDTVLIEHTSTVTSSLSGIDSWSLIDFVPLNPSESYSLVTMSLVVPDFGIDTSAYTTGSTLSGSFGPFLKKSQHDIYALVNVKNPVIPVEYFIVGGGGGGQGGAAPPPAPIPPGSGGRQGIGGTIVTGSIDITVHNESSIKMDIGLGGAGGDVSDLPNPPTNGSDTILYYTPIGTDIVSSIVGAGGGTNFGINTDCAFFTGSVYYDGEGYGGWGNGGSSTGCPTVLTSSITPWSGKGGNGGATNQPGADGENGVAILRYYDPNEIFVSSGGDKIRLDGYTYHYFYTTGSLNQMNFTIQRQEFIANLNPEATGGEITEYVSESVTYIVHTFTGSGTFTSNQSLEIDYLMVGGGGAGGWNGILNNQFAGGGGGGEVKIITGSYLFEDSYSIVVGNGGDGSMNSTSREGGITTFKGNTAIGGGAGATFNSDTSVWTGATTGSSGGGGGSINTTFPIGADGIAGKGNAGGDGTLPGVNDDAGGGGGFLTAGGDGISGIGGAGGDGIGTDLFGPLTYYGGGGGGAAEISGGAGGVGGGGTGAASGTDSTNGTPNTGGGGGAGYHISGSLNNNGGSGIIRIRYKKLIPPV